MPKTPRPDINDNKSPEDSQAELDFWNEERDRFNKFCEQVRQRGDTVELGLGAPPELNEDGSLKNQDSEGER